MKSLTKNILRVLQVLAWLAVFGFAMKGGAILISYIVSLSNPVAAKDLYMGMDLSAYKDQSFINYTCLVAYKVALYGMQVYVAYLMAMLLNKMNVSRPFNITVVKLMEKVSISILWIWLIVMAHNIHGAILEKTNGIAASYIAGDFIFFAGIVYVIAQMFKRGVEIQSENELTV